MMSLKNDKFLIIPGERKRQKCQPKVDKKLNFRLKKLHRCDILLRLCICADAQVEAMENNQENKILVFEATSNVIQ